VTGNAYQYPRPRPKRRPGSRPARIEAALLAELDAMRTDNLLPTSGRFLFYRLESLRIVDKQRLDKDGRPSGRQPRQDVSDVLTELREAQVVGWDEVRDRTRGVLDYSGYANLPDAVRGFVAGVQLDPWRGDPPLLVVESESLAGVLEPLAVEYRVLLVPLGGQGSGGLLGGELPRYLQDGARVLYLGDLDLSGDQIESSARARAEAYAGVRLDWRRLSLTEEQATVYGLEPIVKADKRYRPHRWHDAIETEALDQRVLVRIVRAELDRLLPEPLEAAIAAERAERTALLARLNGGAA
jgi:hypothetical protein